MQSAAQAINSSDEQLLQAFSQKEQVAFEVLYQRYRGRICAYAEQMLQNKEEAEEVCVETFVAVLEGAWKPTGSFRAFLFTIAHRACLQRLRRKKITQRVFAIFQSYFSSSPPPEEPFLKGEAHQKLSLAIQALSEEHRSVILLFYAQDLSSQEIATILGISDQQVRSRLSYARKKLKEILESQEIRHESQR